MIDDPDYTLPEETIEFTNEYIDSQIPIVKKMTYKGLGLTPNSFAYNGNTTTIDSRYILECDDAYGTPLPFGWIATDDHFTGNVNQDYYIDYIIVVDHQGED